MNINYLLCHIYNKLHTDDIKTKMKTISAKHTLNINKSVLGTKSICCSIRTRFKFNHKIWSGTGYLLAMFLVAYNVDDKYFIGNFIVIDGNFFRGIDATEMLLRKSFY